MANDLTHLIASLARLEEWAKHQEDMTVKADHDRKEMMEELKKVSATQQKLVDDMAKVKPVTDMMTNLKNKLAGAMIVLGFIGAVFTTVFLYFKEVFLRILGW